MNIKQQIKNLLAPYIKNNSIVDTFIENTKQKNCFKCKVFFLYKKEVKPTIELQVSIICNFSEEPCNLPNINESDIYNQGSNFSSFFERIIKNRIRGAEREILAIKLLKELVGKEISSKVPNLKITKVLAPTEYADSTLKVDVWVILNFDYRGKFDGFDGLSSTIVGIQIKSSSWYQNIHKQKHPFIPSINWNDNMTDDEFKKTACNLLLNFYKFRIRQLYLNFCEQGDTHNKGINDLIERQIELSVESLHL